MTQSRPAPIREKLSDEISVLKGQLFNMQSLENSGLSLVSHKEMSELKKKIVLKQKKETKLLNQAKTQKKYRDKKKDVIRKLRLVQWIQQKTYPRFNFSFLSFIRRSKIAKKVVKKIRQICRVIPGFNHLLVRDYFFHLTRFFYTFFKLKSLSNIRYIVNNGSLNKHKIKIT